MVTCTEGNHIPYYSVRTRPMRSVDIVYIIDHVGDILNISPTVTVNVLHKYLQSRRGRGMDENFQNISDPQCQNPPYCTKYTAVPMKRHYLHTTKTNINAGSELHYNHTKVDVLFSTGTRGGPLTNSMAVTGELRIWLTEDQHLHKGGSLCPLWVDIDGKNDHCRRNSQGLVRI